MKRIALMGTTLGLMISCGQQENKKEQESYSAFEVDNLDSTIAPCEDFFAFTTNGWMKANPIP
ncbi:MAG: M13 family metallopeptidase, partial [Bacteroidota bacterium]|nr:M13 family metallopeptidase [Bacteroidota bacterium]MDX5506273.1 M13 family metallopeptidase [Bacteroidota bacterium]